METAAEILKATKALISSPDKWTQREYARDASGKGIGPRHPSAVCRCSIGAFAAATKRELGNAVPFVVKEVFALCGIRNPSELVGFNDNHTHAEVLDLFDRAIAIAEARQ